jgi:hypothetical protein
MSGQMEGKMAHDHHAHLMALTKTDTKFKSLVAKYGMPQPGPKSCTELNEGDICMETKCFNGKKIIMKCDGSGGCTQYSEVACEDAPAAMMAEPARMAVKPKAKGKTKSKANTKSKAKAARKAKTKSKSTSRRGK